MLENQGDQTVIGQSSGVTTGEWKIAPTLFQTGEGAVVEIHTGDGSFYFQIENGQMHSLNEVPSLEEAEHLELETVADGNGSIAMKPITR